MLAQICLLILPSLYTLSPDGENTINGWLEQSVLAPSEFKVEVQKFIKRHIPPLEVPDTADEWRDKSEELRSEILQKVIFRGVPEEWFTNKPDVVWGETIETGKGYLIRKLRYEALPGLWIPALLYEPAETGGKLPAVLNVNGHVGPPGKTIDYEQIRCINLAKRGMLALHPEWLFFGELAGDDYKHNRLAYLDLCGTSGVSVFFLAMRRGIDVLEMYPAADPGRIAMTGLSGGGWQTIILTSLDTRISAITPNAGYIGLDYRADFREDIGDLEQNPNDLLTIADYTHLTAMLAPRPTLLIYNDKDDCCFKSYRARPSVFEPIIPFFQLFGVADDFQYHENTDPGTHNYDKDNREQFYRFINRCFLPESDWVDSEIPSDDEVLEYDKLVVGLPESNANFFTLGCELMVDLPGNRPPEMLAQWQKEGVDRLRDVLRFKPLEAEASIVNQSHYEDLEAVWYKLVMNSELSVPAAVIRIVVLDETIPGNLDPWAKPISPPCKGGQGDFGTVSFGTTNRIISKSGNASGPVAIVFSDKGKRALREQVKNLAKDGSIVIATDPMFMGECMFEDCPFWQYAQMVSTVGERPLGIQAAQMGAVIHWACQEFKVDKVSLHGIGWNASVLALCACALHNDKVESVSIENYPESLKKLIQEHTDYEQRPALFCFGLLEQFDMPELNALCSPVKIEMK